MKSLNWSKFCQIVIDLLIQDMAHYGYNFISHNMSHMIWLISYDVYHMYVYVRHMTFVSRHVNPLSIIIKHKIAARITITTIQNVHLQFSWATINCWAICQIKHCLPFFLVSFFIFHCIAWQQLLAETAIWAWQESDKAKNGMHKAIKGMIGWLGWQAVAVFKS